MRIGGWQKISLVDYPGKICTILFTQGCNLRCPYCHNPELVDSALFQPCYTEEAVFAYLKKRSGIIDAVTITGGEPTLQADLTACIRRIKALKYLVKLDTNGTHPQVLEKLTGEGLLDYIAMDIKGPLDRYGEIVRAEVAPDSILKSLRIIMDAGVPYEFRTTVVQSLLSNGDFEQIGKMLRNASLYVLQKFIPSKPLEKTFVENTPPPDETLAAIRDSLLDKIETVLIR